MSLFDDFATQDRAVFFEVWGEKVAYTPLGASVPLGTDGTIIAVWREAALSAPFQDADVDVVEIKLHLSTADVPAPQEGDTVVRVKDGKTRKVAPPFEPMEYRGITVVALSA